MSQHLQRGRLEHAATQPQRGDIYVAGAAEVFLRYKDGPERVDPRHRVRLQPQLDVLDSRARESPQTQGSPSMSVDAVVQIGSAYWLRIPIGKLHNDRYIPLHPQLKELLDDWIAHHRPSGLRSDRLLLERRRPGLATANFDRDMRWANELAERKSMGGSFGVLEHAIRRTVRVDQGPLGKLDSAD